MKLFQPMVTITARSFLVFLLIVIMYLLSLLSMKTNVWTPFFRISKDIVPWIQGNNSAHGLSFFYQQQSLGYNVSYSLNQTTCGLKAFRRGPGQKVVGFSFYGNVTHVKLYFEGIKGNLEQMERFYPGWVMRLYHDLLPDSPGMKKLDSLIYRYKRFDLCYVRNIPGYGNISDKYPLIWRFLPIADAMVDIFVSRDLDSRFSEREAAAVNEWLNSTSAFHIMRDNPSHSVYMLGGMWGVKVRLLRPELAEAMRSMLASPQGRSPRYMKGPDQKALSEYVWKLAKYDSLAHDSYLCKMYTNTSPWPTRRKKEPNNFVGSPVSENSTLLKVCPKECRPPQHKDWQQC